MNPTGHTTADMIFTGLMLVVHLAVLSGLGYLLGRMMGNRRAKTAETLAAMWERHAGDAMRRARLAEDQAEHYKAERNAAQVEARREFRDQIAAAHAARDGMAEGYRDAIQHLSGELAQAKIDWDFLKGLLLRAHYYIPASDLLWGEVLTAIKPNPTADLPPSGGRI